MRGVDVSIFNDPVDWHALKDAGIEFAFVAQATAKTASTKLFNATSTERTKSAWFAELIITPTR